MKVQAITYTNDNCWTDWALTKMECTFDEVVVTIQAVPHEYTISFRCVDHIGVKYIGHWDESIIEDITVEDRGELIEESLNIVRELYGSSPIYPGTRRLDDPYVQMNIRLIDGNTISIACKSIEIIEPQGAEDA